MKAEMSNGTIIFSEIKTPIYFQGKNGKVGLRMDRGKIVVVVPSQVKVTEIDKGYLKEFSVG